MHTALISSTVKLCTHTSTERESQTKTTASAMLQDLLYYAFCLVFSLYTLIFMCVIDVIKSYSEWANKVKVALKLVMLYYIFVRRYLQNLSIVYLTLSAYIGICKE